MNIYLTKSLQSKIQQRAETNRYINQGVRYTYFVPLKLLGVAFSNNEKPKFWVATQDLKNCK